MTNCDPRRQHQLQQLVRKLGLPEQTPLKWELLDQALTHPTASATANYEQLEFLGDAVIRLATAEFLWQRYRELPVSEFAAIRAILVSDRTLAGIAADFGLERYLYLSKSAKGDRLGEQSRLAATLEALAGALYLSTQTLTPIHTWLDSHFQELTLAVRADPARQNYKAALQERTQANYKQLPEYRVQESNQIHGDPTRFTAEVWLQGERLGAGHGRSKMIAEQAAAREAFLALPD